MAGIALSPKQRSALAQALLSRGLETPRRTTSPWQNIGRVLNVIAGQQQMAAANQQEQQEQGQLAEAIANAAGIQGANPRDMRVQNEAGQFTVNTPGGGMSEEGLVNQQLSQGGRLAAPLMQQLNLGKMQARQQAQAEAEAARRASVLRMAEGDYGSERDAAEAAELQDARLAAQAGQKELDRESQERIAANRDKASQAGEKEPKPSQRLAAGYARRLADSNLVFDSVDPENFTGFWDRAERLLPGGLKTNERKRAEQAERNFINAVLRRESGAAIAESEFINAELQYFPRPGDTPSVIEQKKRNRLTVQKSMELEAGEAFQDLTDVLEQTSGEPPQPTTTQRPPGMDKYLQD